MNEIILKNLASELNIKQNQVSETLKMLEEGATIPFIARYRKEQTGGLDEEVIRKINEIYEYQVNLLKRKEDVIRLIDEKGMLDDKLKQDILKCIKLVDVEDLYRPYKEKKKTKATEAIKKGLEPFAKEILTFNIDTKLEVLAKKYLNEEVKTVNEAIEGASFIIAEIISDSPDYRKWIRNNTFNTGSISASLKKNSKDDDKVYEMYYDYSFNVKFEKPHRILAMNRGEKEKVLNVSIKVEEEIILTFLYSNFVKKENKLLTDFFENTIKDSYKRLIKPSIEREIRSELTERAEEAAIENFKSNFENLLMTPPMKEKIVLGLDPAYRTGCKLAVLDKYGDVLNIDVIYPHMPQNQKEEAVSKIIKLVKEFNVDIIAIGNGTASRESEELVANIIKDNNLNVEYIIVNEAGASVYSASKLAIEEFPNLSVEQRSAISIGRRLQDPLAELVKIDPESIGVGMYQHDVNSKKLKDSLDFTITKVVNNVGVNINSASTSLLSYVSGLNKTYIKKIMKYKKDKKEIKSREEMTKVLSDKVYEQAIGFIRVPSSSNLFDKTSIHPESYEKAQLVLNKIDASMEDIGTEGIKEKINMLNKNEFINIIDLYTLEDILRDFKKPNRDPRDSMPKPLLKKDVLSLEDLKIGMELQGTVRNVVDFGAFIDIGLKNDGLAHISCLTNRFVKHPSEVVSVGDIVTCYVKDVSLEKKKVSLTLIKG